MLSFSRKAFQVEAVRKQLKHWYMTKDADQLLVMVAKCSSYQGLTHAIVLKEIHFDITNQSTDKKLALFAIMFGFSYVAHRLTSGKFLDKPTVPKFVTESDVFDKGSDTVKGIIKDVAVARCPTSHQKAVATVVKTHNLGIQNVATRFHKSFKVNTACIELMSRRELLRSMHRLRIDNVLSSEPHAIVDTVSTADTYVRTLNAATAEPPLHPAEVLLAYAEYVLVPKLKLASLTRKEEEGQPEKADSKVPLMTPKPPEPTILTALNLMYQSSFANIKSHDSLKVMVCLDLQTCMSSRWVRNYPALTGSHVAMHVVEVLYRMVGEKPDQMRLVGFKDVKVKPIKRLKLHVKEETAPETAEDENNENNLEQLDDLSNDLAEKLKVTTEDDIKVTSEGDGDKSSNADSIIAGYDKLWQHYKQQVPEAQGVTFHKLLSWATKQQWDPDVFVVICSQENLSLYKNNVMFGEYVQKTNRAKTKLITISPCSHLKSSRLIHAKNMLHIVGFDEKVTHLIDDFLSDKVQPMKVETETTAAATAVVALGPIIF
ncbi:hypothetical protein WDU94_010651 [Cyamophila willieti]